MDTPRAARRPSPLAGPLVLGSGSPRRRELLARAGVAFEGPRAAHGDFVSFASGVESRISVFTTALRFAPPSSVFRSL